MSLPLPNPVAAKPSVVKIQLQHLLHDGRLNQAYQPVAKELVEGNLMRIGRKVDKVSGKDKAKRTAKSQELDEDIEKNIWFMSKVVSRHHCEMWLKGSQIYIRDIGSSSGTFLNNMRMSPLGKESRPYSIKDGDVIQLGVDYKGKTEDLYKSVIVKLFVTYDEGTAAKRGGSPRHFNTALNMLTDAMNPYRRTSNEWNSPTADSPAASSSSEYTSAPQDCPICLCHLGAFQALFISPCSHVYHFKCISPMLSQTIMLQCPLCRQVNNLTASVSQDDFCETELDDNATVIINYRGAIKGTGIGNKTIPEECDRLESSSRDEPNALVHSSSSEGDNDDEVSYASLDPQINSQESATGVVDLKIQEHTIVTPLVESFGSENSAFAVMVMDKHKESEIANEALIVAPEPEESNLMPDSNEGITTALQSAQATPAPPVPERAAAPRKKRGSSLSQAVASIFRLSTSTSFYGKDKDKDKEPEYAVASGQALESASTTPTHPRSHRNSSLSQDRKSRTTDPEAPTV